MIRHRLRAELAIAACGVATDAVAQFDPPDPKVYARAEDHARARLRGVPCTEADVGHGCYRFGDRLVRDAPCATYRDNVIHVLPAPQCFKMTRPQRFRGIWLDDFEGQAFIPAGSTPPAWPDRTLPLAERRAHEERFRAATIWLEVERDTRTHQIHGCRDVRERAERAP